MTLAVIFFAIWYAINILLSVAVALTFFRTRPQSIKPDQHRSTAPTSESSM